MKAYCVAVLFIAASTIVHAQLPSTSYSANTNNITGQGTVTYGTGTSTNSVFSLYLGYEAGKNNQESSNAFIGYRAGKESTSSYSTFIGSSAGFESVNSSSNVMIGAFSGSFMDGAHSNLCMGVSAGGNNEGSNNLFLGYQSGQYNKGDNNIFVGSNVGRDNDTGNDNIYIGRSAANNTVGSRNVFIGNRSGQNVTAATDILFIENSTSLTPLIYGDFSSNKVGINTTNIITSIGGQNISNYSLFVEGGLLSDEVRVRTTWADYVFDDQYSLKSIPELDKYISENGHLPNCPTEREVEEQGLEIGDMTRLQQEKIEELTLYIIELEKRISKLEKL